MAIKDDLVEEIGSMIGYDSIPPVAPLTPARVPPGSPEREFHHRVREMAAAQGFTEVHNYSFISEEMARVFSVDLSAHVQVSNPIASDQNLLRTSLLPGIWKNINDNARHFDHFRLFEIGRAIHPDREVPRFAAALFSKEESGLFELKRLAECLLPGVSVRPAEATQSYEHPRRTGDVLHGETNVGRLFEFHPKMIEGGRAAVLDLDLTRLMQLQPAPERYRPLRRFPESAFDLSVLVGPRVLIADVQAALQNLAGDTLLSIVFLRDFLENGSRSLSYRLTVGASDRAFRGRGRRSLLADHRRHAFGGIRTPARSDKTSFFSAFGTDYSVSARLGQLVHVSSCIRRRYSEKNEPASFPRRRQTHSAWRGWLGGRLISLCVPVADAACGRRLVIATTFRAATKVTTFRRPSSVSATAS